MSKRVVLLTEGEGIESAELTEPWTAVTGAGHCADLVSPESDGVQLLEHLDKDGTRLITSRIPADLPAFGPAVLEVLG